VRLVDHQDDDHQHDPDDDFDPSGTSEPLRRVLRPADLAIALGELRAVTPSRPVRDAGPERNAGRSGRDCGG